MSDTIYALSSGIGRAGVAVVRVSGNAADTVAGMMGKADLAPRKASLIHLRHPQSGDVIDHALAIWFPRPFSFTGEDVLEFQVHGGRAVVQAVLEALSSIEGVRAAEPGEFTRRAFENGKLDLASVEGLADLISADTQFQRRQALRQFGGSAGLVVSEWRRRLVSARALIEAHLDFPDEGEIPVDVTGEVREELCTLGISLRAALDERARAEIIRDGAVVLIAGPPNVGKSTLLNRIAARDVAIISEIPGTTRDLIEITVDLGGIPVTFVDSAGIRDTHDPIEEIGIRRTRDRARDSTLVLWLAEAGAVSCEPSINHPRVLVVYTKSDIREPPEGSIAISALTGSGVSRLLDHVMETVAPVAGSAEPTAFSTQRQFECVADAACAIENAMAVLETAHLELVVEELRQASGRLEEITGHISNDELLDEVFGRFCLGK